MKDNNRFITVATYGIVALIWIGVLIFGISLVQSSQLESGNNGAVLGVAAFICAAVATGFILNPDFTNTEQSARRTAKRKNDSGALNPMSLLTEEDIAELREDIKRSLRLKLLSGQDGELNSLDALLAEQEQQTRGKR